MCSGASRRNIIKLTVTDTRDNDTHSMVDNANGWTYDGISAFTTRLETELKKTRSGRKVASIYRSAKSQDAIVTAEIERLHNGTADVKGNENILLTERRRLRKIIRKIENMN